MNERRVYIVVPRQIIPIKTDIEVAGWIKSLSEPKRIEHVILDQRLKLPIAKAYCEKKQVSTSKFNPAESLVQTSGRLLAGHNAIAYALAYSPPEGMTTEIERSLSVKSELIFL